MISKHPQNRFRILRVFFMHLNSEDSKFRAYII